MSDERENAEAVAQLGGHDAEAVVQGLLGHITKLEQENAALREGLRDSLSRSNPCHD